MACSEYPRITMLSRCERGIAYIEFALAVPILLLLFLGSIEVTRYMLIIQKLETSVSTLADVTTQADPNTSPLTTSQMSALLGAVQDMMKPYTFGASGFVVVSDVTQPATGNPIINWQYCGGGTLSASSRIGAKTQVSTVAYATLPSGFSMISGEEVVISEIFYSYAPIVNQPILSSQTIYRTAIYMPRISALTGFSSTCP